MMPMNHKIPPSFVKRLLSWYALHKRPLPWRKDKDAYKIWLSEIILQQTRVIQGQPYYERFLKAYPTVHDLASATEQEVLHLWQGLGYYSRARNLHKCSKHVVTKLEGKFPCTYEELLKLPGIGTYTAAAIASIAFDVQVAVVDGNVYRVLARLFGIEEDIASSQGQKMFRLLANKIVPKKEAGNYNQALMEFGALYCTPKKPQCALCPFQNECIAYQSGKQALLPIKKRRIKVQKRFFHYLIIHCDGRVYLRKREDKDIWYGLYDFYLIEDSELSDHVEALNDPLITLLKTHGCANEIHSSTLLHQLTHQRLYMRFFHLSLDKNSLQSIEKILTKRKMIPCSYEMLDTFPFPRAIHRLFEQEKDFVSSLPFASLDHKGQ